MEPEPLLTEREDRILQAVVHTYVTTAQPVGSRTIARRYELDLSPATVRNVMADLEDSGFLQQLHTSSGRVPTDRGYRYYVDHLMRIQELSLSERSRIEQELSHKLDDLDEVMRHTSHLLALVTHQAGLVEAPDAAHAQVRRIELMPLTPRRLALLVADNLGRVHTQTAALEEDLPPEDVPKLVRFLNEHLEGEALDQVGQAARAALERHVDEARLLAERAVCILELAPGRRPAQLFLDGAAQLFEQPEFSDMARAREVFGLLEEQSRLGDVLRAAGARPGLARSSIVIGAENGAEGLEELSVVASPYHMAGRPVGFLGVLGPRRMPYSRLAAVVDYTADMLSRFLTRVAG